MATIICHHGGQVSMLAGAALLAIFDASDMPAPVQAALAMQAAAQRLRASWHDKLHADTSLHIGMSAGMAIVGASVGSGLPCVVGEVVGQAVQLRDLAGGGETFISAVVAGALGEDDTFVVVPLPPLRLEAPALQQIFQVGPPLGGRRLATVGLKFPG
jgi:class 3 adenylate cyclase